jgi:hypothetical protein
MKVLTVQIDHKGDMWPCVDGERLEGVMSTTLDRTHKGSTLTVTFHVPLIIIEKVGS